LNRSEFKLTAVSLPVEIVFRLAVTLVFHSVVLSSRAMCEWYMVVGDIIEKMYFILLQHKSCSNTVNWSITPSFIEETTGFIQMFEEVDISVGSEPVKVADFKIGPLLQLEQGIDWTFLKNLRNDNGCMSRRRHR
jgi:hypothetical protein